MTQHTQQLRKYFKKNLQDNSIKKQSTFGRNFWYIYYFYLLIKLYIILIKGIVRKTLQVTWVGISILFTFEHTFIFCLLFKTLCTFLLYQEKQFVIYLFKKLFLLTISDIQFLNICACVSESNFKEKKKRFAFFKNLLSVSYIDQITLISFSCICTTIHIQKNQIDPIYVFRTSTFDQIIFSRSEIQAIGLQQ